MIFYEMFKNDLESRGMKLVFDDDNRYWIDYFFKRWIDVANLYFIHKQKKSDAYISFASKYSTFDELLDDLEEMNEDTYMLNIAAYLCICLVRMAYAANENKPWDVAFYSAQVPHIVEFLPAWRVLRSAHWDGLPIEEAKMVSEEQRVKSEIARKNAEKRNQKYTQLREEAIRHYEENKSQYKSRAEAARAITKIIEVEFRTADTWLKNHIKQQ